MADALDLGSGSSEKKPNYLLYGGVLIILVGGFFLLSRFKSSSGSTSGTASGTTVGGTVVGSSPPVQDTTTEYVYNIKNVGNTTTTQTTAPTNGSSAGGSSSGTVPVSTGGSSSGSSSGGSGNVAPNSSGGNPGSSPPVVAPTISPYPWESVYQPTALNAAASASGSNTSSGFNANLQAANANVGYQQQLAQYDSVPVSSNETLYNAAVANGSSISPALQYYAQQHGFASPSALVQQYAG